MQSELQEIGQPLDPYYITFVPMHPNIPMHQHRDQGKQPWLSGSNYHPSSTLSENYYEEFLVSMTNLSQHNSSNM
jgi:hypothetical protein